MSNNIQINIPIAWEYIRTVRQQVADALADADEELRSAAVMVASELVENAIKYGAAVPPLTCAQFRFESTPEYIQVQIANGLADPSGLEHLRRIINQMQSVESCEHLYVARLQELMTGPAQPNRLGLYRIGFEGKFKLDFNYEDQILTMTARRSLP